MFSNPKVPTTTLLITCSISLLLFFFSPCLPNYTTHHHHYLYTSLSDNSSISNNLQILTTRPHIAGSLHNADAAAYVLSTFNSYSPCMNSHIASYHVSLTYPSSRTLTLIRPHPEPPSGFNLTQENYSNNPYAHEVGPTFHAYAKSGTAVGRVVYANYGSVGDFKTLRQMGVNVSGTVVLARYGKIYRGDIISNACEEGALGVLLYTDRTDYGGPESFPDDKWMPPSGVQVGTVYRGAGDPSTPGWASTDSACERLSTDEIERRGEVPSIPSLPISSDDGEFILSAMGGKVAKDDWQGDSNAPIYRIGPGPGILNLTYQGNYVISKIENVIGVIEGVEEPDRFVILGNNRDAWTFGGVDPNSGTAVLLDIARRLGKLQKNGWRPRRTIMLCNWDAEEYGLIGSTEWVEENREMLASRAVAYLNIGTAVSGPGFHVSTTPQLDGLLKQVAQQVQDPDNSSQTIYDSWSGSKGTPTFGRLGGGGSDYTAFVQHVGVSTIDMSFGGGYPVYHSMYDDFTWMRKFGDPMFQRHVAAASIWGLVALHLADDELLPFNYMFYAKELQASTRELEKRISGKSLSLHPLYRSIQELKKAAIKIGKQKKVLEERISWASLLRRDPLKARELNDRLMMAERAFTDRDGLPGRPWYKHLIYGPSKYNDYGSKSFPGIDDAIEKAKTLNTMESWRLVQHEIWRVSRAITHASLVLNGKLT
ncbi:probable glutamate carboxypeptidase LAMP1 [Papaver somniferum]|uniref:probable glutamate carboxypeptidase LAMP1 n=1 Tax=Papaver somniferum TaxID=3469 RepID=UPI000E6F94B4|nr:probable glutamate carboxypeptidase LAMP1 [Papaver somniferum]